MTKMTLSDRIVAAREAGDWDLHAKLWDERCVAEVAAAGDAIYQRALADGEL